MQESGKGRERRQIHRHGVVVVMIVVGNELAQHTPECFQTNVKHVLWHCVPIEFLHTCVPAQKGLTQPDRINIKTHPILPNHVDKETPFGIAVNVVMNQPGPSSS